MIPYLQDPDVTVYQGDALETLRELPAGSVHMVCTSPPFYGLRDYGTGTWEGGDAECDHRHDTKHQIRGSTSQRQGRANEQEQRNETFRDTCGKCGARRVDRQIGLEETPDLYVARLVEVFREVRRVLRDDGTLWVEIGDSYASQGGPEPAQTKWQVEGASDGQNGGRSRQPGTHKQKDMIGVPWQLAFALRADGWYLRSEIIWSKPNPMPESVTDRPTTSHSRIFLLTKSSRYFYDADAIREPVSALSDFGNARPVRPFPSGQPDGANDKRVHKNLGNGSVGDPSGRNRRSVWEIATQPYAEAHFATWPEKLCEPMILAGCPEGGTVIDPFGGAGTTALVARKLNRRSILVELNPDYCELAARRLSQQSLFALSTTEEKES